MLHRTANVVSVDYCLFKVSISSKFLFYYLILYITQLTSAKKIDLDKMQSFLEVLKTFKFTAIVVHHSHQSSLGLEMMSCGVDSKTHDFRLDSSRLFYPCKFKFVVHTKWWKGAFYMDYA